MRSAYGAGFMYALGSSLRIRDVDMVIGSSGSAATVLCYATQKPEQYDCLRNIWLHSLSTPKFISYTRLNQLMNVDYLIDDIFKKEGVVAGNSLETSSIDYHISVVDSETGTARFINRQDKVDPYELLRASKALPILYRKKVRILGKDYIDGAIGQTPQNQLDFALSLGATRIVFIDDSSPRTLLLKSITFFYALCSPKGLRKRILHDLFTKRTHRVPDGIKLLYIHKEKMPSSIISRSKQKLTNTFELGVKDAINLQMNLKEVLQ